MLITVILFHVPFNNKCMNLHIPVQRKSLVNIFIEHPVFSLKSPIFNIPDSIDNFSANQKAGIHWFIFQRHVDQTVRKGLKCPLPSNVPTVLDNCEWAVQESAGVFCSIRELWIKVRLHHVISYMAHEG